MNKSVNEHLSSTRLQICASCPLNLKGICTSKLYLNPLTSDISVRQKPGYISGCGCLLSSKVKIPDEKCPVGKW